MKLLPFIAVLTFSFFLLGCSGRESSQTQNPVLSKCTGDLTQDKDLCYFTIAVNDKDITLCEKIQDDYYKNSCLAALKNDPSYCGKISAPDKKTACYMAVGISLNNPSFCADISDRNNRTACFMVLYYKTRGDKKICGYLEDPLMKERCLKGENLGGPISNPNSTTYTKMTDPSVCASKSGGSKDFCYETVARDTINISVCEYIHTSTKYVCYSSVAAAKKDASICALVTKPDVSDCYRAVAATKKDISLCEKAYDRQLCYYDVAKAVKNPSYCEKITNSQLKEFCLTDSR